jgi:hypothetical protein
MCQLTFQVEVGNKLRLAKDEEDAHLQQKVKDLEEMLLRM